jgi:hypothetical protein
VYIEGREYVPVQYYLSGHAATIAVDGVPIATALLIDDGFELAKSSVAKVATVASNGTEMQIEFASMDGAGQKVSFVLTGLARALSKLSTLSTEVSK